MTRRPLTDSLAHAAGPPSPAALAAAIEAPPISDLERILALPRRPLVDCERNRVTRLYAPETRALVEVVTAIYAKPPRVSCACRPRVVQLRSDGVLVVARVLPQIGDRPPEPPIMTTVDAFVRDALSVGGDAAAAAVRALRVDQELRLPAADGSEAGHPCILSFNAVQAWTLWEAPLCGGIVGLKPVGSGKTISGILAPLAFPDCRLAVILIEPSQRQH